ncbi:MAG: carboxypeptidase regulatory-like domain-containing protein [Acidobacteria bacterium]|nr:carboxypeptidase regulatory-like domain-containing protein [Acidobacteriota bacterium]
MGRRSKGGLSVIPLLVLACALTFLPRPGQIFGAYQYCVFACTTIQIRPDQTFIYRLDGDLFNDHRVYGTWSHTGNGKIHAVSSYNDLSEVSERHLPDRPDFLIRVVDPAGATIPGATVSAIGVADGESETGFDGIATIPRCAEFEVVVAGFKPVRYRPMNSQSNEFGVTVDVMTLRVDEVWLILYDNLYIVGSDGSVYWTFSLKKLSPAEEHEIFH